MATGQTSPSGESSKENSTSRASVKTPRKAKRKKKASTAVVSAPAVSPSATQKADPGRRTLLDVMNGKPELSIPESCAIIERLAIELQPAHERYETRGLLLPQNIELLDSGQLKVSKVIGPTSWPKIQKAITDHFENQFEQLDEVAQMNPALYVSPETAMSKGLFDVRSDIFALGCILYGMIQGKPLLTGRDLTKEVATTFDYAPGKLSEEEIKNREEERKQQHQDMLDKCKSELPNGIGAVIEEMVQYDAKNRHVSLRHVVAELRQFSTGVGMLEHRLKGRLFKTGFSVIRYLESRWLPGSIVLRTFVALLLPTLVAVGAYTIQQSTHRSIFDVEDNHTRVGVAVMTWPGTAETWWFDESPNLTPRYRSALNDAIRQKKRAVANHEIRLIELKGYSGINDVRFPTNLDKESEEEFDDAARERLREITQSETDRSARLRLDALTGLENLSVDDTPHEESVESLVRSMQPAHSGEELHLQANILHDLYLKLRSNSDDKEKRRVLGDAADRQYVSAIAKYQWHQIPLRALAHSDHARLLNSLKRRSEAIRSIDAAITMLQRARADGAALPFIATCLCIKATAARQNGMWEIAEKSLEEAARLTGATSDEQGVGWWTPQSLRALTLERSAWYKMDRWQIASAREMFTRAAGIRAAHGGVAFNSDNQLASRHKAKLLELHDRHGVALALRYLGDADTAVRRYDELIAEIKSLRDDPRWMKDRTQLLGRQLNSMERKADCLLFGKVEAVDAHNAAKAYQAAISEYDRYSSDSRAYSSENRLTMQYKAAMAHALALARNPSAVQREAWKEDADAVFEVLTKKVDRDVETRTNALMNLVLKPVWLNLAKL